MKKLLLALLILPVLAWAQVTVTPMRLTSTNYASSVTVGGSWQSVIPASPGRYRIFIQNPCSAQTQGIANTESIFQTVSPTQPTYNPTDTPGAIELPTCWAYDSSPNVIGTEQVWLWAATAGHRFDALQW